MKPTIDREWFERRVQLEEGLDVAAGLPPPEDVQDSADGPEAGPVKGAEPAPHPARRARRRTRRLTRRL